jgi:diketogulonate reductase-like aldo/keto reductase
MSARPLDVPTLILNNGARMPALEFGIFQAPPDETPATVAEALCVGNRHVDTSAAYASVLACNFDRLGGVIGIQF